MMKVEDMSDKETIKKAGDLLQQCLEHDTYNSENGDLVVFNHSGTTTNYDIVVDQLRGDMAVKALKTLEKQMRSNKAKPSDKINAAKAILSFGGFGQKDAHAQGAKAPSEMNANEIQEQLTALRNEAIKRAKPVQDVDEVLQDFDGMLD